MPREMQFLPFEELGGVRFGTAEEIVVVALGRPSERALTARTKRLALSYEDIVVRFGEDQTAGVQEISASPSSVILEGQLVPGHTLASHIRQIDPASVEQVGFLISDRLGLMVDLDANEDEPVWITAMSRSDWSAFRT